MSGSVLQDTLLSAAEDALRQIVAASDGIDALIFVGLPYEKMASFIMWQQRSTAAN